MIEYRQKHIDNAEKSLFSYGCTRVYLWYCEYYYKFLLFRNGVQTLMSLSVAWGLRAIISCTARIHFRVQTVGWITYPAVSSELVFGNLITKQHWFDLLRYTYGNILYTNVINDKLFARRILRRNKRARRKIVRRCNKILKAIVQIQRMRALDTWFNSTLAWAPNYQSLVPRWTRAGTYSTWTLGTPEVWRLNGLNIAKNWTMMFSLSRKLGSNNTNTEITNRKHTLHHILPENHSKGVKQGQNALPWWLSCRCRNTALKKSTKEAHEFRLRRWTGLLVGWG